MDIHIKKFKELSTYELYEILKVRVNIFVVEQNCPYHECDDKDQASFHLFAQEENKIIGYLRIIPEGISYNEVSIGRVLVVQDYRGRGIAKNLMSKGLRYIEDTMGKSQVRISAQKYLVKAYQDLGFKVVSEEYLEDGIPHIEMLYSNTH
ncbi:GNAT family N-acetyltransferase [Alkaliphilus pronyensis]|uniref:GNAT family N-acetyltransferase n=1 Tax=Alkaliphilus pronyensis TaxID=1482732 RepID=A0A6I0FCN5_9FIRM|nr:GNAT family N-acetyltransferase [Alkaliphilus pronyensis]KAB3531303.1 GNAT family N-acetyltransferase [Alkaliphilus pronyensis]